MLCSTPVLSTEQLPLLLAPTVMNHGPSLGGFDFFLFFFFNHWASCSSAKEVAHFHLRMMAGKIRGVCLFSLALEDFEALDWHGSALTLGWFSSLELWRNRSSWVSKTGFQEGCCFSHAYLITKVIFSSNYINSGLHYVVKLNYLKHLINPASPATLGFSRMCKSPTVLLESPSRANFFKHLRWGITQIWLLWEPSIKTTAAAMASQSHTFSSKLARTSSYF